jgi:hypothetical protein
MPQGTASALKGGNVLEMCMEYGYVAEQLARLLADTLQSLCHSQVKTVEWDPHFLSFRIRSKQLNILTIRHNKRADISENFKIIITQLGNL